MSVCWLCPGQGSQSPQMLAQLAGDPALAAPLARLSAELAPAVLGSASDETQCFLNRNAQPLIVLYGAVVATALSAAGLEPRLVAGYSVGELTAHLAADALAPDQALRLAGQRAAAMDAAAPAEHGMLAVRGLRLEAIEAAAVSAGARIAIRNGADHAVLAGPGAALAALAATLAARSGAHVVPLQISVPAHSPWLADGVQGFRAALESADWRPTPVTVLSGLAGTPVYRREQAIDTLSRQIAEPLDWARTLDIAVEMGATAFFELGPGSALTRMVRERFPSLPARSFEDFATLKGAVAWLGRQDR